MSFFNFSSPFLFNFRSRIVVTATLVVNTNGELTTFRNFTLPTVVDGIERGSLGYTNKLLYEVALAATSAPTYMELHGDCIDGTSRLVLF